MKGAERWKIRDGEAGRGESCQSRGSARSCSMLDCQSNRWLGVRNQCAVMVVKGWTIRVKQCTVGNAEVIDQVGGVKALEGVTC